MRKGCGPTGWLAVGWMACLLAGLSLIAITVVRQPPWTHIAWVVIQAAGLAAVLYAIRRTGRLTARMHAQTAELGAAQHERQVLQRQLAHRTLHDPLTGLANRTLLAEQLQQALDQQPAGVHPSLLLLDLDGFKDVNDTFGHPVGDELLVEVSRRLLGVLDDGDLLARLGGDEFAILLFDSTQERGDLVAQRALAALRPPYRSGERELYLTTSIGLLHATRPTGPSEALRDADLALYAAKGAGKNQMMRFEPRLREARLDYTNLTTGLRRAVAREEFTLNFQPVVDLTSGATYAVEALLRWTPPGGEPIPPDQFIPVAEETGLIVPIGAWVLDRSCAVARRWYEQYGVSITVNVSGRQLNDPGFVTFVADTLHRHGLPAEALVLEITETVLVTATNADAQAVVAQLSRLREQGIRVAIDDFGTGYSSLSYLRNLPVDVLKIDRSFTGASGADQPQLHEWAFTKAILDMSASLQLQAVAEGVETSDQARLLRRMNCRFAQGFHFSRPVPAEAIDALLAATPPRPPATTQVPARVLYATTA